MIVTLIGIVALIIIILLTGKAVEKNISSTFVYLIPYIGIPLALTIIIIGIGQKTKMSDWEIKEAIEPTISSEEKNTLGEDTYQYMIPNTWSTKSTIINYATNNENAPILVKCERKAKPTIWTLGLGQKETKYIFYFPNDTIIEIELE